MRVLTTIQAADLLGVSPQMLRMWEARFDFPRACSSPCERRCYRADEVFALGRALHRSPSVARAISDARERTLSLVAAGGPAGPR